LLSILKLWDVTVLFGASVVLELYSCLWNSKQNKGGGSSLIDWSIRLWYFIMVLRESILKFYMLILFVWKMEYWNEAALTLERIGIRVDKVMLIYIAGLWFEPRIWCPRMRQHNGLRWKWHCLQSMSLTLFWKNIRGREWSQWSQMLSFWITESQFKPLSVSVPF